MYKLGKMVENAIKCSKSLMEGLKELNFKSIQVEDQRKELESANDAKEEEITRKERPTLILETFSTELCPFCEENKYRARSVTVSPNNRCRTSSNL